MRRFPHVLPLAISLTGCSALSGCTVATQESDTNVRRPRPRTEQEASAWVAKRLNRPDFEARVGKRDTTSQTLPEWLGKGNALPTSLIEYARIPWREQKLAYGGLSPQTKLGFWRQHLQHYVSGPDLNRSQKQYVQRVLRRMDAETFADPNVAQRLASEQEIFELFGPDLGGRVFIQLGGFLRPEDGGLRPSQVDQ